MPGGKNPRVTDQFQEDSRSRDPIRNMNDIDMRLDEDPTCKDYRGTSEEATLFLEETLRDYGSIENGEDEEGDEGDGKYADAIEEDRAPNQNDVGSPDHGGARDVYDVGHRRVLRGDGEATDQHPMGGCEQRVDGVAGCPMQARGAGLQAQGGEGPAEGHARRCVQSSFLCHGHPRRLHSPPR